MVYFLIDRLQAIVYSRGMMRHHKPSKHSPPQNSAAISDRVTRANQYRGWANAFKHTRPLEARVWARKAEQLEKGLK